MTDLLVKEVTNLPDTFGKRMALKFFYWHTTDDHTRAFVAEQVIRLTMLIDSEKNAPKPLCFLVKGSRDVHPGY